MYKINILTSGKYHSVCTGTRYIVFKRVLKNLVKLVVGHDECEVEIYQLQQYNFGSFSWHRVGVWNFL